MTGEIIKSFLVGLGFSVDEKSLSAFNKAIDDASLKVAAMYAAVAAAAVGIFASITSISQGFEDMGYQLRIVAPAVNRWLVMRQAMLEAYSKAGVDIAATVKSAILFNYSLAKTKFALEAVYKSVAARFFPILTKQMDIFREKIYANMPKIQAQLQKFIAFIFKAFTGIIELGTRIWSALTRIWDFFVRLDEATDGWLHIILEVASAILLLLAPFGALGTALLFLIGLWDDFEVWKEGGKTLFDWGPFVPVINAVSDALSNAKKILDGLFQILFEVIGLIDNLFHLDFARAAEGLKNIFGDIGDIVKAALASFGKFETVVKAVAGWAPSAVDWVGNRLSGGGGQQATAGGPLLPGVPGGNNQSVNQQTHITVNGAADANQVGKTVINNQDRVNFDMTRNLKGAMQ